MQAVMRVIKEGVIELPTIKGFGIALKQQAFRQIIREKISDCK
jgi:hypothetical protein